LLLVFASLLIQQKATAQQVSESVEKMDDDSQLSLTVDPKEVWPGSTTDGRTVFTGRLYHQLSRAQVVTWKLNILDSEGHELNSFTGRMFAGPNQHVVFSQAWDGTDNRGNKLAPGTYQTTAFVRLVPRKRAITDLDFESVPSRVCGRPSIAVSGIPSPLLSADVSVPAELAIGVPDVSIVMAPGGRIEGATTSKRNSLREPFRPFKLGVTASDVSM